jgi:hypothetical protein
MLGRIPFALQRSAYNGAKHFLNALTANFRTEMEQSSPGITVSLVSPGVVATEFGLNARHGGLDSRTIPDAQTADQVANVIASTIDGVRKDVYARTGSHDRVLGDYESPAEIPGSPFFAKGGSQPIATETNVRSVSHSFSYIWCISAKCLTIGGVLSKFIPLSNCSAYILSRADELMRFGVQALRTNILEALYRHLPGKYFSPRVLSSVRASVLCSLGHDVVQPLIRAASA